MNTLHDCYYKKTDRAIPLDVFDNYNASQLLMAIDGENNVQKIFDKMQISQPAFNKTLFDLAELGLVEKLTP